MPDDRNQNSHRIEIAKARDEGDRKFSFVRNRILVRLKEDTDDPQSPKSRLEDVLRRSKISERQSRFVAGLAIVDVLPPDGISREDADRVLLDQISALRAREDVVYAEPDLIMKALNASLPNDGALQEEPELQWGWLRIGMKQVWQRYPGNEHVLIGVPDTGWYAHVDLDKTRAPLQRQKAYTAGIPNSSGDATDQTAAGHGTQVVGVIAAIQNNGGTPGITGINMASPLFICRVVLDDTEDEATVSSFRTAVLDIIDHVESHSLNAVVNISWVTKIETDETDETDTDETDTDETDTDETDTDETDVIDTDETVETFFSTLKDICEEAQASESVILCCGAGNNGLTGGETLWPARFATSYSDTVLAVGGTSIKVGTLRNPAQVLKNPSGAAGVPTTGPDEGIWSMSPRGDVISVVAPGSQLKVLKKTVPGSVVPDPRNETTVENGTSLSTAFVSGLASLVWSANPGLKASDVITVIKETAVKPQHLPTAPEEWGSGRIYAPEALAAVDPQPVVMIVTDITSQEKSQLQGYAGVLDLLGRIYHPYVGFEIAGADGGRPDDAPSTPYLSLRESFIRAVDDGADDLDAKLESALSTLRQLRQSDGLVPPARALVLLTGGSSQLAPSSLTTLVESNPSTPVNVLYGGAASSPALDNLRTLADRTHGEMVEVQQVETTVEAGYRLGQVLAKAMGRTVVHASYWHPIGDNDPCTFTFDLDLDDLDLDVLVVYGGGELDVRSLVIKNEEVLAAPGNLPGVRVDKADGYVHLRAATASETTTGTWTGQLVMSGTQPQMGPAMAVVVSTRSRTY